VRKPHLVSGSFWVVIGVLLGFWKLLALPAAWVAGAFYVWVAIFSVLVVTLFWLVANDLYHPREAKRLFGFIGSGGILGGIVGSYLAAIGAQLIGTEHLLLLSAALLVLCWVVVQQLWALAPERVTAEEALRGAPRRDTFLSDLRGFASLLLQSRYLLLLIAVVGISKLVGTLVYYQFNPFIETAFPDQDARTSFTALFFGIVNVVAFIVQFFFTSWVLRRWGLFVALLTLPVGLLAGTMGLLLVPVFWLAAATELYDGSLNYSLQQTAKEVLYLPIDRSVRYKVKPFIDMVVFRFGKGVAALIGILLLDKLHVPAQFLSYMAIPLVIAWLLAAIWLRRDYVTRIRTILQARAASGRPLGGDGGGRRLSAPPPWTGPETRFATTGAEGPAGSAVFRSLTDGRLSARKLALIDRVVNAHEPVSPDARALIAELAAYETRVEAPFAFDVGTERLKRVITDQQESMAKRCQAVRLLGRASNQATVDYLFGIAMVEADAVLRQEALSGLVKLRLHGGKLEFPLQPIRRQVAREVANYQRILHVAQIYRQHHRGRLSADDPLIGLLHVLLEESVEQIFRLLMLLYRPDDIHLVYEQLQVPDPYLRADAIELLDNLIDSAMRTVIGPILDEDRFLSLLEEGTGAVYEPATAYRLLQSAIWDHNYWLSVTTLCAVGRLRLTAMRQELEKAAHHTTPIVSTAARVALHLATLPS